VVPEAPLETTAHGLVAKGEGWYVVNLREARWRAADGRGAVSDAEGDVEWPQVGVNVFVLGPGEPMSMYHWEVDQEDFLVVSGEAVLIVEGQERPLGPWDFFHCPSRTRHTIVGAGDGPCVVVAVGARDHQNDPDWGGYPVDEVALGRGAGVEEETDDARAAYARVPRREPTSYRPEWLGT
jgi:uncharacterized cupin superfamily protein